MADEKDDLKVKSWDRSQFEMDLGSERVPNIYTNNVQIGFSNWDTWFQFGEILNEHEGRLLVAPKVRVVMSLQHAKAFHAALEESLLKFEETFGEIVIPVPKNRTEKTE